MAGALAHSLSRLFRLSPQAKARMAENDSHPWSTYVLLEQLGESGPLRAGVLAKTVRVDPSRVSRMIADLTKHGFVVRQPDPHDGRASALALTPAGEKQYRELRRRRDEFFASVVADWPLRDRKKLVALLDRFMADFMASATNGRPHSTESPQLKMESA